MSNGTPVWTPPPGYGPAPHPGGGGQPQQPRPMGPPQYEFSQEDNVVIGKAAFWARMLAISLLIAGGLTLFSCNVVAIAFYVIIAIPFLMAANSLQRVVDTQGSDISHMMEAIQQLGTAFVVKLIVTLLVAVITVGGTLLVVLFFSAIMAMSASLGQ